MKIVQIIPSLRLAGAERVCEYLSLALKEKEQEVVVISFYGFRTSISERLEANGIKVIYLDKKSGFDFSIIGKLKKAIKSVNPDLIHTHLGTLIYCFLATLGMKKRRWIHTVHSVASEEAKGMRRRLRKYCFQHNKIVPVALSAEIQKTIVELYKLDTDSVSVVLNGIELGKCIVKTEYTCDGNFEIIHIGRFMYEKNHLELIRAFKIFHEKYPDSTLRLVGEGELFDEVKACVETLALSDSVEFMGMQSNVYGFLNTADMFTLPSIFEGIPMTLAEAMGTGLPIVATAVGGVPDMLENNVNALLCEVDAEKIAECFEKYYLDEQLRERHGKAALERSKAFSAEEMARKYLAIYKGTELV